MMQDLLIVSLTSAVVIALLLLILPHTEKRYSAKWRTVIWIVLALRLLIPFRVNLPSAPIRIPSVEDRPIVFTYNAPVSAPAAPQDAQPREKQFYLPQAKNTASLTLYDLIFVLWLLGAIGFFGFHIGSYLIFIHKVRGKVKRTDANCALPVYTCEGLASPMLYGYFKPKILLPHTDFSPEELDVILQHEQMHYRRGDLWVKLLLLLTNAVHWFNPLVHMLVRRANRDLEYACDDAVLRGTDMEFRKTYAKTILKTMADESHLQLTAYTKGEGE